MTVTRTRLALAVLLALVVAELVVVQPVRVWGAGLADDPERFARLVDLLRAAVWLPTPVVVGLGYYVGRMPTTVASRPESQRWRWLWNMLDTFSEGMVGFDHDGRVAFANQAALRMLGRTALPDGTPMAAFADVPRLRTTVAHALLDGRMDTVEVRAPGARTLLARAAPCDDGALLLLVDVTAERAAIEAREAFLSDAAHELRTPVAAVSMGIEALEMGALAEPGQARRMLDGIARHNERMKQLLDDLLSLARLESGAEPLELAPVNLGEVVGSAVEAVDEEGRVEVVSMQGTWVQADELALYRVLDNLLANALAYSDDRVEVALSAHGPAVRITVADRGPGLAGDLKERVFDRFFRVDAARARRAGGTGLGLAIVRGLVERSDGRVWAEDNPGGGTRFVVELRVAYAPGDARRVS
ncbi:MAG: PAS domain-containing sensor histidine kinase [Alphaproteobacteria bacterium]|nr:PAS domain-containing sensor histidine kinase [Alphaproteobacteria bacterium]MCB9693299.1 PAS domain-containing sensor histidine kinase [Alphaproteobacteria bacterium]